MPYTFLPQKKKEKFKKAAEGIKDTKQKAGEFLTKLNIYKID